MKVENFLKIALLIDLLDLYTTGLPLNQRAKQLVNRCVVANKNFVRFLDKGSFVIPRRDIEKAVICGIKNENILWEELS